MTADQTARAARYDRTRVEAIRMTEGEKIRVAADFAAVLGDELVAAASWTIGSPCVAAAIGPDIADDRRSSDATLTAIEAGVTWMRCEVVTDGARVLRQEFVAEVAPSVCGGQTVTVSA